MLTRTCTAADHVFRFGNFIGEEAEASDEEFQQGVDAGNYVYDDDVDADEGQEAAQELMEIDGEPLSQRVELLSVVYRSAH